MLCLPQLTLYFSDLVRDPGGRWTISDTPTDERNMAIQRFMETGVVRLEQGKIRRARRKRRGEGLDIIPEQVNVTFFKFLEVTRRKL